jgi:hypothetical protein
MQGAVVGSPGTLPTNWGDFSAGLSRQVTGIGTEDGVDYVDIRYSGTATDTVLDVFLEGTTNIIASNGQLWTVSAWLKIVSAPTPPTAYNFRFLEFTDAGAFITAGNVSVSPTTTLNRLFATRTLSGGATVGRVRPALRLVVTNGNPTTSPSASVCHRWNWVAWQRLLSKQPVPPKPATPT